MAPTKAKKEPRRGSPEVIAKGRSAKALNAMFVHRAAEAAMDGHTRKHKRRLVRELQEGKRGETLKAHEVLGHVTELLLLGENLASIRALEPRLPGRPPMTDELVAVMRETQQAYGFAPQAWRLLGVDIASIMGGLPVAEFQPPYKRPRRRRAAGAV